MTTEHPRWSEFAELSGFDACEFRETADGSLTWNCTAHTRDQASAILRDMGATDSDLLSTLDTSTNTAGYCDCEILMNIDARMSTE